MTLFYEVQNKKLISGLKVNNYIKIKQVADIYNISYQTADI